MRVKPPPLVVIVKLVAVDIAKKVIPSVALVNAMLPEPKAIARVLLLLELKVPVLKVKPASASVPCVRVKLLPVATVIASARVTVMPEPLTVVLPSVFVALVTVPDARNVGTTDVYVPPEASVRSPAMFKALAVTVLVLPVKTTFLK